MGDDAEFTAFVRQRQAALVRLGWALTGDRQLGEDLAQATLDRLWRRWRKVSAVGDPWPYTQRIAVSLASTQRRRLWRAEIAVDIPDQAGQADETENCDTRTMVAQWLRALPHRQREVVVLRFLADLPVEETATMLHCSPGTVKSQTAKALTRLRAMAGPQAWPLEEERI